MELAQIVGDFLAEGLRRGEQCWYVASGDEVGAVVASLRGLGIDTSAAMSSRSLVLVGSDAAYASRGGFDPEATLSIFNGAIEKAHSDGFIGFRAAAEMSWALNHSDGTQQLIVYEALLRSLFASCRAIGLCLYDRKRMPLRVLNGALETHPFVASPGQSRQNPYYDSATTRMSPVADADVLKKLNRLVPPTS
jgi:hypothetical protein